ncbi:MAG: hypothetical protein WD025_04050, partial [Bacteriovoracaceae bacterium]
MKRFAILLLCSSAFGQLQDEPQFDFSVVNKLREREQKVMEQIVHSHEKQYNKFEQAALKVQVADILSSPVYQGHIQQGSYLINLATNEQELLSEDIYVKVHSLSDAAGFHYLQNEKGIATHKALATDIANIAQVTKMYEEPLYYRPVTKSENISLTDKELRLFTEFNLHLGLTRPLFTRDLTNDQSEHVGRAIRYEAQTYGKFNLPYSVGASLMFENANGSLGGQGDSYSTRVLSFGPLIKFAPFALFEQPIVSTVGFRSSIFAQLIESRAQETLNYNLAQTSLFLGAQREF